MNVLAILKCNGGFLVEHGKKGNTPYVFTDYPPMFAKIKELLDKDDDSDEQPNKLSDSELAKLFSGG